MEEAAARVVAQQLLQAVDHCHAHGKALFVSLAGFPREIYTRGCHWFPQLLPSS
jgi:hypothetical protein